MPVCLSVIWRSLWLCLCVIWMSMAVSVCLSVIHLSVDLCACRSSGHHMTVSVCLSSRCMFDCPCLSVCVSVCHPDMCVTDCLSSRHLSGCHLGVGMLHLTMPVCHPFVCLCVSVIQAPYNSACRSISHLALCDCVCLCLSVCLSVSHPDII